MTALNWSLLFNYLGIVVGAASALWVYSSLRRVGGKLVRPFQFVVLGTLFQVTAFVYTIVFSLLKLFPAPKIDYHHAIMALGMVCFVLAAKKFADLTQ